MRSGSGAWWDGTREWGSMRSLSDADEERRWAVGGRKTARRGERSERTHPDGGRGVLDRHREADADEHALAGRVEDRRDDADDLAVHRDERPARVAGVRRRVELDQVGQEALALGRAVLALEAGDDARRRRRADAERAAYGDDLVR